MGFFENFRNGLLGEEKKSFSLLWPDMTGQPQWRAVDVDSYIREGFNINSLVYSSIMYKARAVTTVELKAYSGDYNKPTTLGKEHALSKVVSRPNPYQSYPEFQSLCIVYLNISGDCFIYLDREDANGFPVAMYPLKPTDVKIIPKKGDNGKLSLAGYLYTPNNGPKEDGEIILPRDMIHVKLPNPKDELSGLGYGLSPLSAAARNADVANAINDFLKLFFEKGVVLPGVLITEQPLNAKSIARIRERWKEVFGGYKNWAEEIGILERGTEYQRVGLTFDEMGLEGLDRRNEVKLCLAPQTKILTLSGLKEIRDIVVGDKVYTHRGRWKKVTKCYKSPIGNREVFSVKSKGLEELIATGEHPVWAANFSQTRTHKGVFEKIDWTDVRDILPKKYNIRGDFMGLAIPQLSDEPESHVRVLDWIEQGRISIDEVDGMVEHAMPQVKAIPADIPLNVGFGRLLGLYLAEGSMGNGLVQWTLHEKEIDLQQMILKDLKNVFGLEGKITEPRAKCVNVRVWSTLLARLIKCGTARTKTLPEFVWQGNKSFRKAVVDGWAWGDGHFRNNSWRVTTASEDLAWQMWLLAISVGYSASVAKTEREGEVLEFPSGREYKVHDVWRVRWQVNKERKGSYRFYDNHWVTRVRNREEVVLDGYVYNLEVEEDNSYLTLGGLVHNCGPFGVPPILIGAEVALGHSSYKDIPQARKVCWEDTIIPELTLFESAFQYSLSSKKDGNAWVSFDYSSVPALLENVRDQVDAAFKLHQMGFPANEATRAVGLRIEPTKIGDYSFVPVNLVPVLEEGEEGLPNIGAPIGERDLGAEKDENV